MREKLMTLEKNVRGFRGNLIPASTKISQACSVSLYRQLLPKASKDKPARVGGMEENNLTGN